MFSRILRRPSVLHFNRKAAVTIFMLIGVHLKEIHLKNLKYEFKTYKMKSKIVKSMKWSSKTKCLNLTIMSCRSILKKWVRQKNLCRNSTPKMFQFSIKSIKNQEIDFYFIYLAISDINPHIIFLFLKLFSKSDNHLFPLK